MGYSSWKLRPTKKVQPMALHTSLILTTLSPHWDSYNIVYNSNINVRLISTFYHGGRY